MEVLELLPRGLGHASGLTDPSPLPPLPPLQNQAVLPPSARASLSLVLISTRPNIPPPAIPMAPSVPRPPQQVVTFLRKHASNAGTTLLPTPPPATKPTVDPATLAPRDQKPTNESVEPAPARAGSAASSTEHSSTRQGAQAGAEDRQHRAQSLPRSEGHHTPPPAPRPPSDYAPPTTGAPRVGYVPQPPPGYTTSRSSHRCWALQEWIHEQQPLWATRVEALKHVPPLFEAIKQVKTETGLTWDVATSVDTYFETPTKVHGLVGACFSRMWLEPALAKHFPTYAEFNLVATTISTVYNEAAKNAGLLTRMCKFLPTARGAAPPKQMRIYHSKGDKDDKAPPARTIPAAAASSTQAASSSSKRPKKGRSNSRTRIRRAKDIENRRSLRLILTNQRGTGTGGGNRGVGKAMGMPPSHGRDSTGNLWYFFLFHWPN